MIFVFGAYELDTRQRELRYAGQSLTIEPQALAVLTYLIEHRDRTISKEELFEHLWPDRFVSEATLKQRIFLLRKAIGDSGSAQGMIRTLHRRGYRFVAEVDVRHDGAETLAGRAETPPVTAQPASDEHKWVTALSIAMVEAQRLSVRLGYEKFYSLLRTLYELALQYGQQYEGTIQQVATDRLVLVFGAPVALEDHAQRALLAALEIQRRVAEVRQRLGTETLQLRMGLHTGAAAVRGLGHEPASSQVVIGDAVFTAVTLQEHSPPEAMLCSEATAQLLQGLVPLQTVPTADLPMPVWRIQMPRFQPLPMGQRQLRTFTPFVGRERELANLQALLEQAQDGQGQVVGLMGEPGIGKTRLLYEFVQRLPHASTTLVEGYCQSYGHATPYLPLRGMVRQLCGLANDDSPETMAARLHHYLQGVEMDAAVWEPYLLALLEIPCATKILTHHTPEAIKTRTFEALHQLFLRSSQRQLLIVVLENLHWIDPTSEAYLASLVERLASSPLLLLLTYRPGYRLPWIDKSYVTQLTLPRLTHYDSLVVVQAVLQTPQVAAALVQEIVTRAAGNPLCLEELAQTVRAPYNRATLRTVPATIQALVTARIDRLPTASKRLLQLAAVAGNEVPFSLLQSVAGMAEQTLQESLGHLQSAELLYESPRAATSGYVFKHALTQEATYQSLLSHTRQQYHRQIAYVLAAQFPEVAETQPELLAQHYTEAGLIPMALGYWRQAGQRAIQRSAYAEAQTHLATGLALLERLPAGPERLHHELVLRITLGPALVAVKGLGAAEVEEIYTRALELCQSVTETPQLLLVLVGLWIFYFSQGRLQTCLELGEHCQSLAQRVQTLPMRLGAHLMLGITQEYRGELLQARTHLEQAAALYDREQHRSLFPGMDPGVYALCYLSWTLLALGYYEQARQRGQEALYLAQQLAHPFSLAPAYIHTAVVHYAYGELQNATAHIDASLALARDQGFAHMLAYSTIFSGVLIAERGQPHEGMAQIQRGFAAFAATGATGGRPGLLLLLLYACKYAGAIEAGLAAAAKALQAVEKSGERYCEAELYRAKGDILVQAGTPQDLQEAVACFEQALEVARQQQAKRWELRTATSLGRLWQRQGKRTAARQLLAETTSWFREGFATAEFQEAQTLLTQLTEA